MVRKVTLLFPLLIAAIATFPEATLAQSSDDSSGCYMQMPGGRSMDLSALCGQSTPTVNSRSRTNSPTRVINHKN